MADRKTPDPSTPDPGEPEAVWTYRGYHLRPGEFTTAMVHLFRAEVQRANVWRQRLDSTTNWAVITTGAAISFAFSRPEPGDHNVIILDVLLVTLFLYIEARRYRYYELWSSRVRLMETDFFATMLVPPFQPAPDWAESLAENLLQPHLPISLLEALGRRFRRNYLWIYIVLDVAWLAKVWLQPTLATSWSEFLLRAGIGAIPGQVVLAAGIIFNSLLMVMGLLTIGLQQATGEVLPRFEPFHLPDLVPGKDAPEAPKGRWRAWFRPSRRRQQLLAFVVTDRARPVADRILSDMGRGATALSGVGMYTEQTHAVLMCALTVTEAPNLRSLVLQEDPQAFVMLTPAQEVMGKGFLPLETAAEDDIAGQTPG
ncbi:MAG: DUF2270 domain-containing protein [Anaerolineae bacterium]